jgi:hypothetical protein
LFEHDLFGKPVSTFPDHALIRNVLVAGVAGQHLRYDVIDPNIAAHEPAFVLK